MCFKDGETIVTHTGHLFVAISQIPTLIATIDRVVSSHLHLIHSVISGEERMLHDDEIEKLVKGEADLW